MSRVVVVANQKGGVAKSTTAGAMAAGLKQRGCNVLAVDMDPQGNLSYSVGAEQYECMTIYNVMRKECEIGEAIQKLDCFDIVPANIMLAGAEQELSQTGKEHRLRESLEPVRANYDFIIIDTPPSLGVLTINGLTAADEIIVPTTASIFAAAGMSQLDTTIKNVKRYCNHDVFVRGILITKFGRGNIHESLSELTETMGNHMNAPVFKVKIRNRVGVEEAQANKQDLFTYDEKMVRNMGYDEFVSEYLDMLKEGK